MTPPDYQNLDLLDLFRLEVETQAEILNHHLLALEQQTHPVESLVFLMRAAHSVKGAAKIVQIEPAAQLAHALEECFVAAQNQKIILTSPAIDTLLQAVDLLLRLAQTADDPSQHPEIRPCLEAIEQLRSPVPREDATQTVSVVVEEISPPQKTQPQAQSQAQSQAQHQRGLRVNAENLNRLMGLAGEVLVEAGWLVPFMDQLQRERQHHRAMLHAIEQLQSSCVDQSLPIAIQNQFKSTYQTASLLYQKLTQRITELEGFVRRSGNLSDRLYQEVIAIQMRPFIDGIEGLPRRVRDLGKQLEKQVQLEILGQNTPVDREILEQLEAPLIHILQNAVAHGIEVPSDRLQQGKSSTGLIQLAAKHQAGMLVISIQDDGRGVDLEQVRQRAVQRGIVNAELATQLTEIELIDLLFLPGFSTTDHVTDISGRGVGLDVVRSMVQKVGGLLRAVSKPGAGLQIELQLPLTLSVVRALLVEVAGELYGFTLTRIDRILQLDKSQILRSENRQFIAWEGENIGLVSAQQVLELPTTRLTPRFANDKTPDPDTLSILLLGHPSRENLVGERHWRYGVIVNQVLGVKDLVVRPLDPRFGKIQDVSAAALLEDGNLVLLIDGEDFWQSIEQSLIQSPSRPVQDTTVDQPFALSKHILVVDDSITVREVERKLLENRGYQVDVAINGMDAWNAMRMRPYDLVITDVDMPRLNGIELVSQMKQNPQLKNIPVIIVSYKDREEDFMRGLDVGANYYLTKSSFHDDRLLQAVADLIG